MPTEQTPAIAIEDLSKRYGDTVAVDGLSLRVAGGTIVGLIGPDGAGKTSTMRIVCGLLRPDAGHTRVLGLDSAKQARELKHRLGYMPQTFSLYPDLSVAENLRFFADMFGLDRDARVEREARVMEFSQLGPFRARRAGQLSGGMKQKLALSCTLIHTPQVLVLDEPTTGVDPVSRREFWRILRELARDGIALLVSTPYMDEADLCDEVVLMHRGRALLEGTPDSIPGYFPRKVLSVSGDALRVARERLMELGDVTVHRFGDRLHVVYDEDAQLARVRDRLQGLDIGIAPIRPSIEDVFVELTSSAEAAVA